MRHRRPVIRGRTLVALAAPILAGSLVVTIPGPGAHAAGIPRVLVVGPLESYGGLVAGISEGLQASGFRDATQVRLDVRNVRSLDEAKTVIQAAVGEGVEAIVTVFGQATQAAHQVAPTVPVIFCPVADPVATKLVASVDAPGGHLTGIASADAEATRRRVAAFRQVLPNLRRLGVLFDPGFPPDRVQLANLEQIAPAAGLAVVKREATDAGTAARVLQELGPDDVDAVFVLTEPLLRRAGAEVGPAAVARRVPLLVGDPDLAGVPGVVASVGPDQRRMGILAGELTARILRGASPATQPVVHPPFELILNLKTATEVGVDVPEATVRQAARVIR
jgi:putative ABC transport system substrate-binding protein